MDKTEIESAEISQSESSGIENTEPDENDIQTKAKSFNKDLADTESDGLDNKDEGEGSPNPDAKPAQTPKTQRSGLTKIDQTDDRGDRIEHLRDEPDSQPTGETGNEKSDQSDIKEAVEGKGDADQPDQQQGSPEVKAPLESQPESQTDQNTVDGKGQAAPGGIDQQGDADENETVSEHVDLDAPAVDGAGAPTDPAEAFETSAEDEAHSDQTQSTSEEAPTPQANAETPSEADDAGTEAAVQDHHRTQDQEEPDDEAAEQALDAAAPISPIVKIAVSAVLIIAVFSGFFIFENKSKIKKDKTVAGAPSKDQPQPPELETHQIVDIPSAVSPSIYDDSINEVGILRETLLKKQAEILALIKRYRQSIEELENEILDAQRKAGVHTFLQATNQNRIVFSLKTIQRRQAYIKQLQKPFEWVSEACEELLYLKRRAIMDLHVSAIASGIDMDRHVQQMHRALKEYRPTADKLAIDPTDARLESLETIWQRVQNKQDIVSAEPVYSKNQMISAQVCAGDFSRIGELSEMTAKTAKCITGMQSSDLFLNQITEISPAEARQLCEWKGSWICMNGIRALSPRVAHYLFQWDGDWISLNGLVEFPAEIGEALLRWKGRQLELMGLIDTADAHARIGIEYLAEWERSGGKLFVPENLRKKIDALHQQSG